MKPMSAARSVLLFSMLVGVSYSAVAQDLDANSADKTLQSENVLHLGSVEIAQLAPSCVKPAWPIESLRREEQGVVVVDFLVDADGVVTKAAISKSSGFSSLDAAAKRAVERCRFPGQAAGDEKVERNGRLRYTWSL